MTESEEQSLLDACAELDTSTWSDALDQLGIEGVVEGIPRRSGMGRMCGFAVTARQTPGRLHDFDKADFAVNRIVESVGPLNVLVIDVSGQAISTLGGLASFGTHKRGARGVVIDGGCRDIDEIQATGLWLASRHVTPRTGKGRLCTQGYGDRVTIGGVSVANGDLVVGDDTGIVVVPRERLTEALECARKILVIDKEVEARMKQGESFDAAARATGYVPAHGVKT